ncbi:MAG: tRNA (cytidine(56)-2'-O)-methyltransferase [Candidatus Aenigmarchaeota archaeon ex4484_14]|nr:MAG: tRNA (cytidine(56)-2'-O)-methyltransferase [Candidatus Aenigmarchaeota archaeon ex4484_14]
MIVVLRLGHRPGRDARLSTHVGLAARALGADAVIMSGEHDENIIESIKKVTKEWGGHFQVSYEKNWRNVIKNFHGVCVHLTMYGLPIQEKIDEIRKNKDILIVVGGEKVPAEVYQLADYNISVTNQPHSEVAALAIFLHEYFRGKELDREFEGGKIRIIPQARGKKTIEK